MRMTPGHPDYARADAYLDGVLIPYCITADEEAGEVRAYALRDGRPFMAEYGLSQKILTGKVTIRIRVAA